MAHGECVRSDYFVAKSNMNTIFAHLKGFGFPPFLVIPQEFKAKNAEIL